MAYPISLFLLLSASEPYYWPEQTDVVNLLKEQFSGLNACEPESLDAPVAIRLNIDSNGSVISVEIDSKPLPECMTKEMQQWTFMEHHEETAVLHLSITVRESTFYLLPGSFVEQRHVKQRYWMPYPLEKPFKHTDESPGSKSSEHFIEDQ